MNMRKTGLLLTGGLAVMLVVFIAAYGVLLGTETMPVHIEIKEPPTADQQHGNIALPSVIESVDPEYLLTNIYSATDSQAPSFAFVDTDGSGNTVSSVGVFDGSVATPVITFGDTPTRITLNDVTVSGADAIPAAGEVRVVGGSITVVGNVGGGGYVDGGGSAGNADNTALIRVGNLAVSNTGWASIIYAGHINADAAGGRVEVAIGDSVLITGGNTLITGLNGGGDICRASVIAGRTIVDPTDPDLLEWGEFGGRAAEARVSGLLGFHSTFSRERGCRGVPERRHGGEYQRRHCQRQRGEPGHHHGHDGRPAGNPALAPDECRPARRRGIAALASRNAGRIAGLLSNAGHS